MRKCWFAIPACCLVRTMFAQVGTAAWHIEVSSAQVSPSNPSVTVRVLARYPQGDYAWGQAGWDVLAGEGEWSDLTRLLQQNYSRTLGTARAGDVLDIQMAQLNFANGGPWADPSNPLPVWEATWTATNFTPRAVHMTTVTRRFDVYPERNSSMLVSRLSLLHEGNAVIRVVPTPTAALLLVAAFAARRRRV